MESLSPEQPSDLPEIIDELYEWSDQLAHDAMNRLIKETHRDG